MYGAPAEVVLASAKTLVRTLNFPIKNHIRTQNFYFVEQTDKTRIDSAHTNATKDGEIRKLKLDIEKANASQRRDGKSIQELKEKIKKLELEKGELTVIRVCISQ